MARLETNSSVPRGGTEDVETRAGGHGGRSRTSDRDVRRKVTAVGYCRRSTDRQEQSIPDQQRTIERYCTEHGLQLVRWYIDDAISGTSTVNRPGFQQMIADAGSKGAAADFGVIVVYDVKRFGRVGNDEAGYYRHLLRTYGVEVIYATEGFNGGETDDLLRPVKQWQARQESKDLSKVTIRGLLSKSETGAWLGGVPPHGYDLRYTNDRDEFLFVLRHMPDGTKQMLREGGELIRVLARGESVQVTKRDRARLVPGEPGRIEAVRRIFTLYVEEKRGLKAIADELNRSGAPTPRGPGWSHIYARSMPSGPGAEAHAPLQGGWRDSTVRAILVNPLYAGDMVWNRRTDARFHMIAGAEGGRGGRAVERKHVHGARLVPNDEADWIVVRDTHEGLVSRGVFEKARTTRTERPVSASQIGRPKSPPAGASGGWTGARSRFALSGLCRCAQCGERYQGVTRQKGKPRNDGSKVRTYSYACGGYIAKGTSACQFNPVGQAVLEQVVLDAVLAFYAKYDGATGLTRLVIDVRQAVGREKSDLADARKRLESERKTVETSIANLLDNVTATTRDLVEERLNTLRQNRKQIDARFAELDRLAAEEGQIQDLVVELGRFLSGLGFALLHGVPAERLGALRRCIEGIVIDKPAGIATVRIRPLPAPSLVALTPVALTLALNATPQTA